MGEAMPAVGDTGTRKKGYALLIGGGASASAKFLALWALTNRGQVCKHMQMPWAQRPTQNLKRKGLKSMVLSMSS